MPDGIYGTSQMGGVGPSTFVNETEGADGVSGGIQPTGNVPSYKDMTLGELADIMDLPDLPASMRGISIDQLLQAVADEERRNGIKSAVDGIKVKGDQQKAEGEKKLEEIRKKLEEMKNQSFWQKLVKVFQVIAAVFTAIAAVATTALGAVTGNPLLVAAGVFAAIATIDSVMNLASDGKLGIAQGFEALGKACGMSDEAAKWFGFGMNMGIMVVGIAVTFGAGFASSAGNVTSQTTRMTAETFDKTMRVLGAISSASSIGSGVSMVGTGAANIGLAVVSYNIAQIEANKVDIDKILENLRLAIENEKDLVEEQMQIAEDLMAAVKDIIESCEGAANAVLGVSPPAA